jgi:hypothetical protein
VLVGVAESLHHVDKYVVMANLFFGQKSQQPSNSKQWRRTV